MSEGTERPVGALASVRARLATLEERFNVLPGNVRGSLWLFAAAIVFAFMSASIKHVGQTLPVIEILFFRQIFVVIFISPAIARGFPEVFRTKRLKLHLLRVTLGVCAMTTGFTAIVHMPLAEVTSITFSKTLFTTILAVLILREIVDWQQWAATGVGFLGVLIIAQPTGAGVNEYALLALFSSALVAGIMILTRVLTRTERPITMMSYHSVFLILLFAGPTWYLWVAPSWPELAMMVLIGLFMSLAQYTNIQAYRAGEASAIQPMEYVRLLTVTMLGFAIFDEIPTVWTMIGAAIIVASTLYSVRREAMKRRTARLSTPGA